MKAFALFMVLMWSAISHAQVAAVSAGVTDKFDCEIAVSAFKNEPGYTAKLNLAGVRKTWTDGVAVYQDPLDDVEATINSKSGLEVQLHYQYNFKNVGTGWSLYRCLSGYSKYKGESSTWACPQLRFPVDAIDGVPQFGSLTEVSADLSVGDDVIGSMTCRFRETSKAQ